jgi:phospholipid/cholesterol/gamma-HCH transport system permease protein
MIDDADTGTEPSARLATETSPAQLALAGSWRLASIARIKRLLDGLPLPPTVAVDGSELAEIDSAAALVLLTRLAHIDTQWEGFAPNDARIIEQVRARFAQAHAETIHHREGFLEAIGRRGHIVWGRLAGHANLLGAVVLGLLRSIAHPRLIRVRELSAQFEQTCINAIPVVALVTVLLGIVFAYLLGLQAQQYGANIFVVDGVAIGTTREFAPIIVAIIVAGRSGAAFTAQLGAMRLTEETDAIRTLGLDPIDVLVLPRVIALMVALPLLVFIGNVMGLFGAMLIAQPMLDITPTTFIGRLRDSLAIEHVYVGLIKAPVFALFIAVIGCRMGMFVERDTRAVGMATTSTVVQSIVAVILLDAAFAVLFQELGI